MTDEEQGAVVFEQEVFEDFEGFDVEVVGGLVEDEQVGGLGEETREQQTIALAAREGADGRAGTFTREKKIFEIAHEIARASVDRDDIPSLTDIIEHRLGLVELRAELIEVRHLDVRAMFDFALRRFELTHEQFEKRGLARTVGANDTDLIAALNGGGEVINEILALDAVLGAEDGAGSRVCITDVLGFDDNTTRLQFGADLHADFAREFTAFTALFTQTLQGTDTSFVARAARFDALTDPGFFLRELFIEEGVLCLLSGEHLFFAFE